MANLFHGDEEQVLPMYFSLKSKYNNKFLRYTNGDDSSNNGHLRYSDTILVSPYTKFSIKPSETSKGLVHIRSCYNNKFWVRLSENSNYIGAIADEQEDDESKWWCTLFKPIFVSDQNAYCFLHVQLNLFLCLAQSAPPPYTDCLAATVKDLANNSDDNNVDLVLSIAVNWDSIFILPKYTAFKSNNAKYLKPLDKYLQFSAPYVDDIAVTFEIISVEDAYVSVKHVDSNKYWIRGSDNWIRYEAIDIEEDDPNALVWPVKVDSKIVGLRNKGNNNFCKRFRKGKSVNYLSAVTLNLNDETSRLEVKDVGIAKNIEDVEYHVNDARVYSKEIVTICEGIAINNTEVESEVTVAFKRRKKVERIWSSTVSKINGVATKFVAKVPIIGELGFSFEVSDGNKWDEIEMESSFEEVKETILVAPMSKVKYAAMISQASYDIPFSYDLRETLQDSREVTNHYKDGFFTGFMTFGYRFEIENLSLWFVKDYVCVLSIS